MADEQPLVDRVAAFDREHRQALEAEFLVKRDRSVIVVQDRQVHPVIAPCDIMFGQPADQRFADAGMRRLRIDRERPQRRALFRIVKGERVIDAGHRPDQRPALMVLATK
jgi:hypothetical protein